MTDHFERLGLPRRLNLDSSELTQAFHAASRVAHPDHGGTGSNGAEVLFGAAAVNDAFAVLRDPLKRAEHLLTLQGGPAPGTTPAAPAFLLAMMELRERLEAGDLTREELAGLEQTEFEAVERHLANADLTAARQTLDQLKTLASLRRDLAAATHPD